MTGAQDEGPATIDRPNLPLGRPDPFRLILLLVPYEVTTSNTQPAALVTAGRVCLFGKLAQEVEEFPRLPPEQSVVPQSLHGAHGRPLRLGRTDDRHYGEFAPQEDCGLGHDQAGLEVLTPEGWGVEVGKRQPVRGISQRGRVSGLGSGASSRYPRA